METKVMLMVLIIFCALQTITTIISMYRENLVVARNYEVHKFERRRMQAIIDDLKQYSNAKYISEPKYVISSKGVELLDERYKKR